MSPACLTKPLVPALLLAVSLALTGCLGTNSGSPEPRATHTDALRGSRIRVEAGPLLERIAVLEDSRWPGQGELAQLAQSDDAVVRKHALRALGRMPFPEEGASVTAALLDGTSDADLACRATAIFALGMRGDASAGDALFQQLDTAEPKLRPRIIEALSRLDMPQLHQPLLILLGDTRPDVQIAAVLATARWSTDAANSKLVDRALVAALLPEENSIAEGDLRWRILFALQQRKSTLARGAFVAALESERELERLYAARGLGWQESDDEIVDALTTTLANEINLNNWRVAVEVIGALERLHAETAQLNLIAALEAKSFHVRARAAQALGTLKLNAGASLPALGRALRDISPTARNAALVSFARLASPEEAWNTVQPAFKSDNSIRRLGAVRAAGVGQSESCFELLVTALDDPDTLVRGTAASLLAAHGERARPHLQKLLSHSDNGMRLAAVVALEADPDPSDMDALIRAYDSTRGDISTEVAFHAILAIAKQRSPKSRATLERALDDSRYFVRRIARQAILDAGASVIDPVSAERPAPREHLSLPAYAYNPIVEVRTTKGVMVFELFPGEAPVHVHNFILLARRGHYNGKRFHRVVSDFVIQGGDYRGDGNGAAPAFGAQLPHEIGARPYERGSLGMPRYEDIDSGGSQFFVTHRPTPRLDGRYTIFGELRSGGAVLDDIEVGDRILGVELVRNTP